MHSILVDFNLPERNMPREALEVGAFTWSRIQRLYDVEGQIHWTRCEAEGFECPHEVFAQLFHEDANDADFAATVRAVDWGRVRWELEEFSGIAMRHVRVDRGYQYALDEARERVTQSGIHDDRTEVLDRWRDARSWITPTVMVSGDVMGTNIGYELLVGVTRLGNLLGGLDRQDVSEVHRHLVWTGRLMDHA
jgi:hypothetical protein